MQEAIDAGKLDAAATVDVDALVKAGVLRRAKDGVRLLGTGEIKSKVDFAVYGASKSALAAVEKAGGSVKILPTRAGKASSRGCANPLYLGRACPLLAAGPVDATRRTGA